MRLSFVVLFVLSSLLLRAQTCPKYTVAISKGTRFLERKNYDSALVQFQVAQIAARECGLSTEAPAKQLQKVFEGLQAQRDEAKQQRDRAIAAQKEAVKQKAIADKKTKEALAARRETELQNDAFRLITLAQQTADRNPTLALRIAEAALNKYSDSLIYAAAQKIYGYHAFYKTIIKNAEGVFEPLIFSNDGKRFLTEDGYDILLLTTNGSLVKRFTGHASPITDLAFSPDNTKILSVSMDSTARIWKVSDETSTIIKTGARVWAAAFSPDGQTFVTGSDDSTVRLWDSTSKLLKEFKDLKGEIRSVIYSPDGLQIFACTPDSDTTQANACLWTMEGTLVNAFQVKDIYKGIYLSNTLHALKSNSSEKFELMNMQTNAVTTFSSPFLFFTRISFSQDGSGVLVGSRDTVVRLFNVDGTLRKEYKKDDKGLKEPATGVAFSPDGMNIFSGSEAKNLTRWSREGDLLKEVHEKASGITAIAGSPDGTMIFTSYQDSLASLRTGSGDLPEPFGREKLLVRSAAFSPEGTEIYTGSADSILRKWNLKGELLMGFPKTAAIVSIDFSPDGAQLLTAAADDTVRLWSRNGVLLKTFSKYIGQMASAFFTTDGIKVLTIDAFSNRYSNFIRLWNVEGTLVREIKCATQLRSAILSPDRTKILGAYFGKSVIWDTSGKLVFEYRGERSDFSATAYSHDGSKVLAGSYHGKLKIWETVPTLEEFLRSDKIDKLTLEQQRAFGIQ